MVDGDVWWQESPPGVLPRRRGGCACPEPVRPLGHVGDRAGAVLPRTPVPLDLVAPVDSFALAATADGTGLGTRTVAGRDAVGVTVTAAQVAPFLDGLAEAAELRPVHPADPVEMWLDAGHLVPLAVDVRAGDDPWRAALGRGRRAWSTGPATPRRRSR